MGFFRFIPSPTAAPFVYVYHEQGAPTPLEPGDYSSFKEIPLPPEIVSPSIDHQLEIARAAITAWSRRQSAQPFGKVIGYEFALTNQLSIFLDEQGEFDRSAGSLSRESLTLPSPISANSARPEYVVGHRHDGFCSIHSFLPGETADDQDLFYAERYHSLGEAQAAAERQDASIFQVIRSDGEEQLRELTVDLALVTALPFSRAYFVAERLLAGPTFLALDPAEILPGSTPWWNAA